MLAAAGLVLPGHEIAAAEPYAFRGLALGTPLTELRRLRFPEAPNARTICTHDPEGVQLRPSVDFIARNEEIEMGVIVCGVFNFARQFAGASSLPPEWIPAKLSAAGLEVAPVFWYVPGHVGDARGQAAPKLYRIAMRSNAEFWQATRDAFARRYGAPTRVEKVPFVGYRGMKLDNEQALWVNAESTIMLTKRSDAPNRLQIVYEHATLTPAGARLTPPLPASVPAAVPATPAKPAVGGAGAPG